MDQLSKIFNKKLSNLADTTLPVACSVLSWYQNQRKLVDSAYHRREALTQKNAAVAEANLKYRSELQQKIEASQKKHAKNRKEQLTKIVKTEERKNKYVQEIASKHKNSEKMQVKERIKSFRENQTHMEQFWSQQKLRRETSYSEQVAAPPLYNAAVERKKKLEEQDIQEGMKVKLQLLDKHLNRQQLVYKIVDKKQQEIHQVHEEQIQKNIEKHQEIMTARRQKFINQIGRQFAQSQEALKQHQKQLQKKIKDKIYDDDNNRKTVRSIFLNKQRNKSATLSDCKCKRINNVEEGLTSSINLLEKQKTLHFTDTLKVHQKIPSHLFQNRSNFLARSYSVRSTVSKNQDMIKQRVDEINTDRLRREKEIAEAIELKKSLQVQGNCFVRVANVK